MIYLLESQGISKEAQEKSTLRWLPDSFFWSFDSDRKRQFGRISQQDPLLLSQKMLPGWLWLLLTVSEQTFDSNVPFHRWNVLLLSNKIWINSEFTEANRQSFRVLLNVAFRTRVSFPFFKCKKQIWPQASSAVVPLWRRIGVMAHFH